MSPVDTRRRWMLRHAVSMAGSLGMLSGCGGSSGAIEGPAEQTAGSASADSGVDGPVATSANTSTNTATTTATTTTTKTTATTPSTEAARTALPPAAPPPPVAQTAPRPSWADAVPLNTWHTLPGTAFLPWARTNIPAGSYLGTNPLASIITAFSDPAHAPSESAQYFYGGGHGDGTCNAVCKFDHQTLKWTLVGAPTPPEVYLPGYMKTSALTYPSGTPPTGWFLSAAELPAPEDAPYRAPQLARVSTHMYAAAAMRGSVVHYFYLTYAEFDVVRGTWTGIGVDLGKQLTKFRPQYGEVALQQGTVAVYDEVSDRFFVTLNPGDSGGGWRNGILVFNPNTRQIESVHETGGTKGFGFVGNSVNVCKVGRDLYVFQKSGSYGAPTTMDQGFVVSMDSMANVASGSLNLLKARKFKLSGDLDGATFPFRSNQETIPSWYDGVAIRRWNYCPEFVGQIFTVNVTPISGAGTVSDPLVLQQTRQIIAGTPPTRTTHVYSRLVYHNGARCAMLVPDSGSDWVALNTA